MMGDANPESLCAESARLLVEFLDRELELTQTLIDLTRIELQHGSSDHASEAVGHVQQGLQTIRRFIDRVPDESDRVRIIEGLGRLEKQVRNL